MPPAAQRKRLPLRRRLLFALVPLLLLLLGGELLARLFRAPLHFGSFRELRVDLMQRGYPAVPDARLGYVPKPGYQGEENHWGTRVAIDEQGFRKNGPGPQGERWVLAVGDSFTFGDQVDDDATWPAALERKLGRPVKNGGVFGYSFVQAVLRAEELLPRHPFDTLVVSLIAGDLDRNEYSKRYTPVPWFDLEGGQLVLRNCPVVDTSDPGELAGRPLKNLLGRSALLDAILANVATAWWVEDEKQVQVEHLKGRGAEIGSKLVERIAAVCRQRGVKLLLVLQGERATGERREFELLRDAQAHGVQTLDLVTAFLDANAADSSLKKRWFKGHMTREGNAWVAERIAEALARPN